MLAKKIHLYKLIKRFLVIACFGMLLLRKEYQKLIGITFDITNILSMQILCYSSYPGVCFIDGSLSSIFCSIGQRTL